MIVNKIHNNIWCYQSELDTRTLVDLVEQDETSLEPEGVIFPWYEWYTMSDDTKYIFGYQKTIWNSSVDTGPLECSNSMLATSLKEAKNFLIEASTHYANHFNLSKISHSSINISKYIEGKAMGAHVDSNPGEEAKAAMTAILYLNDNYEGGELFFREQQVQLKPVAGTVVVFPSHTPFFHQSFLIKKGFKYIMALFWEKDNDI